MMKKSLFILLFSCLCASPLLAQNDFGIDADKSEAASYFWPKSPKVKESLNNWQGYKFGIIIHMGLYSELGTIESWGLCPEEWVGRNGYDDYYKYATDYRNTNLKFNPVDLDAEKWAKAFKGAGAKYMIFTSKHHDGFCLYDSKFTDFKVTDKSCPFSTNPKANILKEVLDASRNEGLKVGVYFSKPDWTSQDFWWSYYPPKDRNPTYDILKHPDRWKRYVEYTQNQINELTTDYGKVDILWLDGCWVMPKSSITDKVKEFCFYPHDMDINMKLISERAREKNPGMLVVDRWVQSEYQDYLTPEQKTPKKPLLVPWESCITMGGAWGWVPNQRYKSPKKVVQLLINIVAKGGNLLLGIGPNGKGEFDSEVYENLAQIGKWLDVNGEAIYNTQPIKPFLDGKVAYTTKEDHTIYALYMPAKDEKELPAEITVKTNLTTNPDIYLLASKQKLKYKMNDGIIKVYIPKSLRQSLAKEEAVVIEITKSL